MAAQRELPQAFLEISHRQGGQPKPRRRHFYAIWQKAEAKPAYKKWKAQWKKDLG